MLALNHLEEYERNSPPFTEREWEIHAGFCDKIRSTQQTTWSERYFDGLRYADIYRAALSNSQGIDTWIVETGKGYRVMWETSS